MAKELPYFRFTPQEWQNGDISLEGYELKGLFIDICSYYWVRDCSITIAMLEKRYSGAKELLEQLLKLEIIKVDKKNEFVQISFLNEQFDTLSEARKRRQKAGSLGGKKKSSNAKAMLKQSSSYKDKDKDKDKNTLAEMPFSSSEFLSIWKDWKEYKSKEFKFKFKSSQSEKSSLTQLTKISNNDEATAIKIIENSIANGWKGFFPLTQSTTYSQNGHSTANYGLPSDFKIEVDYFPPDQRKSPYPINKKTQMLIKGEKYVFDNPYKSEKYHVDEQGRIIKTEELID